MIDLILINQTYTCPQMLPIISEQHLIDRETIIQISTLNHATIFESQDSTLIIDFSPEQKMH